ncbi:DMT family transporter [Ruegeria sp. 2012CJ41-6]|uniref:DMT family transporter n=1 Tax=Ruegeria spongiae TaxID=2942209 RepID=A0ABT0PX78_9RHOB|nr:DMT family transporter [Ruegeria spongiae]MCL6282127.1 DMT family transporter [Ruegeria spongiae]
MQRDKIAIAYCALLLAMLVSSGNFLFGNLAVKEVPPVVLAYWRSFIAAICVLPFVFTRRARPVRYFLDHAFRISVLAVVGVVFTPWLVYLALRSNDLIDLGAGYTSVPLLTILFSALLLNEKLRALQYLGVALALAGALVFAFRGSLANLLEFNPHLAFLLMIASNACRALYLVLLRKWDMHPKPEEGLFVILVVGVVVLSPVFIAYELSTPRPFDYSWQVWGSICFVGIGMGAIYLHLINFGTREVGASSASLFSYLVPIFVSVEAVLVLGADLHAYQGVGTALIICGVLIATRLHSKAAHPNHAPH